MQNRIKNIRHYIASVFGVIGILSGVYWSLLNAKFGLLGIWFGQKVLDMANAIMGFIKDLVPYIVFVICVCAGLFWLITWLLEKLVWNKKSMTTKLSKDETIKKIEELLDNLK